MCQQQDNSPQIPLRSPSLDSHGLALMAFEQPSPDDFRESVVLMRRWTCLPHNQKPEVHFEYRSIRSRSSLGFLVWLVSQHGSNVYMLLREEHPTEAEAFRHQLSILCESQSQQFSRMGGSGLAYVFSRALANHAREFPQVVLGDSSATH
jgi:hypothetical protein